MILKTILAFSTTAASVALAFPSTPHHTTNATESPPGYRVTFSHNCPATSKVFPHFVVTNGSACATQNLFDQPSSQGEVREYMLKFGPEGQSTWTFYIDDQANSTGPRARSLVEATCELNSSRCYMDISNIEAASNGFEVTIDAETCSTIGPATKIRPNCAPLSCRVPSGWQCPIPNRFNQDPSKNYPLTYLDPLQSCVSNCTLYGSDEACCKNANSTEQTCTNQNPALRDMCEDAYSYAYDDKRAAFVYQLTLDGDTAINILACP